MPPVESLDVGLSAQPIELWLHHSFLLRVTDQAIDAVTILAEDDRDTAHLLDIGDVVLQFFERVARRDRRGLAVVHIYGDTPHRRDAGWVQRERVVGPPGCDRANGGRNPGHAYFVEGRAGRTGEIDEKRVELVGRGVWSVVPAPIVAIGGCARPVAAVFGLGQRIEDITRPVEVGMSGDKPC